MEGRSYSWRVGDGKLELQLDSWCWRIGAVETARQGLSWRNQAGELEHE